MDVRQSALRRAVPT